MSLAVAVLPSGFVITTLHWPGATPTRLNVAVSDVPLEPIVTFVPEISGYPGQANFGAEPEGNAVPKMDRVTMPELPP
jgi:hypothetical protein